MKLYELRGQYQELQRLLEDGEVSEEALADTIEGISGEIQIKADNIACLIKNLEAESAMITTEAKRQLDRAKRKTQKASKLREYLKQQLILCNIVKIDTTRNSIQIRNNPPKLEISEQKFFDWAIEQGDDLLKFAPPTPDRIRIKEALKNGREIPFVELKTEQRIEIK